MTGGDDRRADGGRRPPGLPLQAASRITGLVGSVMDLHVRIALQEADREKRRLIGGAVLLGIGFTSLMVALVCAQVALGVWFHRALGWGWLEAALALSGLNLLLAGLLIRIGGRLTRGPYLPETMAGLGKTTRAVLGR